MSVNVQAAVDESSFLFDGLDQATAIEALEGLLDVIDDIVTDGHRVAYSSELFTKSVHGALSFYDLYGAESPFHVHYEVKERVAAIFATMLKWDDDDEWPETFNVTVSGAERPMPTVAWLLKSVASKTADAACAVCLASPSALNGELIISAGASTEPVWFLANEVSYRTFLRKAYAQHCRYPDDLRDMAQRLFPQLEFVDGAFDGVRDMSKSFRDLAPAIVEHLSALSDHGARIFAGPWSSAPAEFGALGIDLSDENGNTKQNSNAKRARQRQHKGGTIEFWWHTKIEPDRDRIHFDQSGLHDGGKIVVGIFCRHLVT